MKHKFCFLSLIKLKYTTIDKHLIATEYSNFLAQFSGSLNNIMCVYVSIIIIVIGITIRLLLSLLLFSLLFLLLLLFYYYYYYYLLLYLLMLSIVTRKQYHRKLRDQNNYRTIGELKLLTFYYYS